MQVKSTTRLTRLFRLLTAGLIASLLLSAFATVASADASSPGRQIAQVREATAPFRRVATAQATGYAQFLGCIDEPGQGAMGIHFVNGNFVGDTVLNPLQPEALVYEPGEHGQLKLVALEYIVFQAAWTRSPAHHRHCLGRPSTSSAARIAMAFPHSMSCTSGPGRTIPAARSTNGTRACPAHRAMMRKPGRQVCNVTAQVITPEISAKEKLTCRYTMFLSDPSDSEMQMGDDVERRMPSETAPKAD